MNIKELAINFAVYLLTTAGILANLDNIKAIILAVLGAIGMLMHIYFKYLEIVKKRLEIESEKNNIEKQEHEIKKLTHE